MLRPTFTAFVLLASAHAAVAQTFLPAQTHNVGGTPRGMAVGDFDGDGTPDVAVALFDGSSIAVLAGTSTGFGPAVPFTVPARPIRVAAGDVDGDGDLDLAVLHQSASNTVTLLLGNGDGTFAASLAGPVVPATPSAIALADFDGDGRADLLVGAAGSSAHVYPALGGGAFGAVTSIDTSDDFYPGSTVVDIALGDIDGDGDLDALTAGQDDATGVLTNEGAFAFTHHYQFGWWGYETFGLDLADIDQDGKLDLFWIEGDGLETGGEIRQGEGNGTFGSPMTTAFLAELDFVRFAQLDVDGDPDHVGAYNDFFGTGVVRYNFGAPGIAAQGFFSVPTQARFEALETFDLDGDGFDEVALTDSANRRVVLLRNVGCPGPATLAATTPDAVPSVASPASSVQVDGCDLDAVASVVIGGSPAAFEVAPDGRTLTASVPQGLALGAATIELHGTAGLLATTAVDVVPAAEPVLALDPAGDLSVQSPAVLHVGGTPGDLAFLFVSPGNGPSTLPGVLDLAIGDGFASLFLLVTAPLSPATASAALPLAAPPVLVGATFHFQAAVLDSATFAFPLAATNVVTATVVP